MSPKQMQEIHDYYTDLGLDNIVISSYTSSAPLHHERLHFLINDDILGRYDRPSPPFLNSTGLNYQLITTQRGIEAALDLFPNSKYILKLRADQRFDNIDVFLEKWMLQLGASRQIAGSPFRKKIVVMSMGSRYPGEWYIQEASLSFGLVADIKNLWSIPTTQRDSCRAEDYVSTFYLVKHFSGQSSQEVERTISNRTILQYSTKPSDYFIFDYSTGDAVYSYKHQKYMSQYAQHFLSREH